MLGLNGIVRLLSVWPLLLSVGVGQSEPNETSNVHYCGATYCAYLPAASKSDLIGISKVKIGLANKDIWAAQGMIFNASDKPIYNARIELRITNLDSQVVTTREVATGLVGTLPGQANPFYIVEAFFLIRPRLSVEAKVKDFSTTYTSTLQNLEVVSYAARLWDCQDICVGYLDVRVKNPYAVPVRNARLLVWTTDSFCESSSGVSVAPVLGAGESTTATWEFCRVVPVRYPTSDLYIVAQGEVPP
jgi:hypothetical protein